jgi:Arc/MetJ family transcription regulator
VLAAVLQLGHHRRLLDLARREGRQDFEPSPRSLGVSCFPIGLPSVFETNRRPDGSVAAFSGSHQCLAFTQKKIKMVYSFEDERKTRVARTNIEIDEKLITKVIELTGARSKREAVEIALRRLVEKGTIYRALRRLRGKLPWKGDVGKWRALRR